MKNLITGIACLILLLAILTEFTYSQVLYSRVMEADRAVSCFRETVRTEGYVSEHSRQWVRERLAEILRCRPEEVEVSGTGRPEAMGALISYSISAPLGDRMAMARFWNADDNNDIRPVYEVRQYVTSVCPAETEREDAENGSTEKERGETR